MNSANTNQHFDKQAIQSAITDAVARADIGRARALLREIQTHISVSLGGIGGSEWDEVILNLQYVIIPQLDEKNIIDLCATHLTTALQSVDLDIEERLRAKIIEIDELELRDKFKTDLLQALESSNVRLTSVPLFQGGAKLQPTVANWLKVYREFVAGSVSIDNSLIRARFISQEVNYTTLAPEHQLVIQKLIKLYEFLRLSSAIPKTMLDEFFFIDAQGRMQIISNDGQPQIIGTAAPLSDIDKEADYPPVTIARKPLEPTLKPRVVSTTELPPAPLPFVQPTPAALKSPDPAFFFDLKDEEEADVFRIKNQELGIKGTLEENLRALAVEVIAEHNFKFKDEVAKRRFAQIFVSFMKDVRDIIEVREVMLKSQDSGGLGLTSDKVEAIIKIFNKIKQELPAKIKQWQELGKKSEPAKVVPSEPKIIPEEKIIPVLPPQPEIKPAAPDPEKVANWRQEMLEQIAKMAPVSTPEKKVVIKPRLVDVKAPPRVFGPLEELKEMNLVDFRRLGPTANEVVNKIWAKIQLIGETGIGRKYQATRAWQASRVYRMYVNLGRASIEQVKPVTEIITQYQTQGEDSLTVAEFEAIADLNQKLRF